MRRVRMFGNVARKIARVLHRMRPSIRHRPAFSYGWFSTFLPAALLGCTTTQPTLPPTPAAEGNVTSTSPHVSTVGLVISPFHVFGGTDLRLEEFPQPEGLITAMQVNPLPNGEIVSSHHGSFTISRPLRYCAVAGSIDRGAIRQTEMDDIELSANAVMSMTFRPQILKQMQHRVICRGRESDIVFVAFFARMNSRGTPNVQQLVAWQYVNGLPAAWWIATVSRESVTSIDPKWRHQHATLPGEYDDQTDRSRLSSEFQHFLEAFL